MDLLAFYIRAAVYIICLLLSFYGLSALDFKKFLKQGYVRQAQILYVLLVLALAYLSAGFILGFIRNV